MTPQNLTKHEQVDIECHAEPTPIATSQVNSVQVADSTEPIATQIDPNYIWSMAIAHRLQDLPNDLERRRIKIAIHEAILQGERNALN